MQIMTIDEAKKRQQHDAYLAKLYPMGEYVWRPTMTEEQEEQQNIEVSTK